MPLSLSPAEMNLLLQLAAPIELQKRSEFLTEVAEALARTGGIGEGAVHRLARVIQRKYFDPPEFTNIVAARHGARA
jgi:hypothetical protein